MQDIQGEPLPGVAVCLGDGDVQTLTDMRGQYQLSSPPGAMALHFMKTGYTAGHMALESAGPRTLEAAPASLWLLPESAGVYLYENSQYRETTEFAPKPFSLTSGDIAEGAASLDPLTETFAVQPILIAYRTPHYDIECRRLVKGNATPVESNAVSGEVWLPEQPLPVEASPIDEPERVLIQLRFPGPLGPGVYAIHWGSLDGFAGAAPRAFAFRVRDPNAPPEPAPPEATPEKTATKKAATEKPKSEKPRPEKPKKVEPAESPKDIAPDAEASDLEPMPDEKPDAAH